MNRGRVLLVEDDENDVILIRRAFSKSAAAIGLDVVSDGIEALKRLQCDAPPNVVLLDLRLAGLSGFEVLRRIREDPRTRFIPVIILTNSTLESDRALAFERGANSYVAKPLDEETLETLVFYLERYWVPLHRQPGCPE